MINVRKELLDAADSKYKDFNKKLIPNVDESRILGVRIPQLRKIAKKLDNDNFDWHYYEEVMLHGFYIGYAKLEYNERLSLLDKFIPKIDNWAVCDCVCSTLKFINKNQSAFLDYLGKYMKSEKEYELRFAAVALMDYYINENYADFVIDYYKSVKSDFYYVNMAVSWGLCTAFVKYRDKVLPLLESKTLSKEIQNITISKIRDSYKVDKDTKEYLKALRAQ